jgi:hypothetical protein
METKFATILLDSIDEALSSLGQNVKLSIYFHLENKFSVPKEDIPDRIEDFSNALEQIFGLASKQLEILIIKHLHQKINLNYKWAGPNWLVPNLTFEKYVKLARLSVESSGKTGNIEVMLDEGEKPKQKT